MELEPGTKPPFIKRAFGGFASQPPGKQPGAARGLRPLQKTSRRFEEGDGP
jgi:hypothetical protein